MLNSLKRFHNVESFRDVFTILTWQDIERIAAIPIFLFLTSPFIFFWHITIHDGWRYGMTLNTIETIVIVLSILCMFCGYVKHRIQKFQPRSILADRMPQVWFLILCLLILISTIINGFTPEALHGDGYRGESIFSYWIYFLCYYGCATMIRSERLKAFLMHAFLISSVFISVMTLLDKAGIIPVWHFHMAQLPGTLTGNFFQYNHYGYFLLLGVTLSFSLFLYAKPVHLKILYLLSGALHTVTLVINNTRGCYVGCVGALLLTCLLVIKTRKPGFKTLLLGLGVFIAATAAGFVLIPSNFHRFMLLFRNAADIAGSVAASDPSANADVINYAGTGRGLLWKLTLESIVQKPVFGWGTEGIGDYLSAHSLDGNDRPHNEYLQYAAFYGIPAALVYITALLSIYRKAYRQLGELPPHATAALLTAAAYLGSACFGNTMFYTAPFLFIMLGLGFHSSLPDEPEAASRSDEGQRS